MKKNYGHAFKLALLGAVVLSGVVAAFSQSTAGSVSVFSEERRPFDFSDKYYYANGIEPEALVNRRNGADGQSVPDSINDSRFRDVRILSVYPAYDQDGRIIYFNLYGELYKDGFQVSAAGDRAAELAHLYPLYIFPSTGQEAEFRQAHLINLRDDGYFEKNFLGLSVQIVVEFTDLIKTEDGQREMAALAARNGYSGDGTPLIKTALEIEELTGKHYVTQKIKGLYDPAEPSFAVAKVLPDPQGGAIAPDAFLLNDLGLKAEQGFVEQFECLQAKGRWCDR
jgi:hypothetical protein